MLGQKGMKMNFRIIAFVGFGMSILVSGCMTKLTQEGTLVKVVKASKVRGCSHLGEVEGWDMSTIGHWRMQSAYNEARNEAAEIDGTHAVVKSAGGPFYKYAQMDVYDCSENAPDEEGEPE